MQHIGDRSCHHRADKRSGLARVVFSPPPPPVSWLALTVALCNHLGQSQRVAVEAHGVPSVSIVFMMLLYLYIFDDILDYIKWFIAGNGCGWKAWLFASLTYREAIRFTKLTYVCKTRITLQSLTTQQLYYCVHFLNPRHHKIGPTAVSYIPNDVIQ